MKKRALVTYNFIIAVIITIAGLASAQSVTQVIISLAFLPVAIYFTIQLFKRRSPQQQTKKTYSISPIKIGNQILSTPSKHKRNTDPDVIEPEFLTKKQQQDREDQVNVSDTNKRIFLKFIGTSSIAMVIMALFTKKAQAAFFGSIPGPGTVSIKDSSGSTIDPAEKQPTDGYEVSEIDDSGTDTYYGFVHTNGSWYITKEDTTGAFRYIRGSTSFSTSWTNRAGLSYDYYNNIFS
ncbi:hypothetical protein ACFL1M_04310 [Patescibacteria group bacterium]